MAKPNKDSAPKPAAETPTPKVDGAASAQIAKDEQATKKEKTVAKFEKGVAYVIADGKSVTTKRGIIGPGHPIAIKHLAEGQKTLEWMVGKGLAVPAPPKPEAKDGK